MDLLKGLKLIWFVSSTPKLYKYRYKYFLALLQVYSHLTWRQTVKYVKCKIQGQPLILLCILLHGFRALLSFLLFFSRKLKYFLTISTRTTKVFFFPPWYWFTNMAAVSEIGNKTLVCQNPHSFGHFDVWHRGNPLESPTCLLFLQVSMMTIVTQIMDACLKPLGQSSLVSQILVSFLYILQGV